MRTKVKIKALFVLVAMLINLITPSINVFAGVADPGQGNIIRVTTTNYHTTIVADFSLPEKNLTYHKESNEIEGNISDDSVESVIQSYKNDLLTWFNAQNVNGYVISEGVSSAYYEVHDEIVNSKDESKDENTIIVGDLEDLDNAYAIQGTVTINTILDKYQVYTISLAKDENMINAVNITLDAPKVGEEIKENDNCLVSILTDNIELDYAHWVKGTAIEGGEDYDANFVGTVEKDKYYYAMIGIVASDGFSLSNGLAIKVNGETPAEVFGIYDDSTHFIAKIKAKDVENTKEKDGKVTYKVLDGENQKVNIDKEEKLSFRFDIEYSKFSTSGKVFIDDKLVESSNYTSKEGSTIITFNDEYTKNIPLGEHNLRIEVADGDVNTKFEIEKNKIEEQEKDNSNISNNKVVEENKTNNPSTGDNIDIYIGMFIMAVVGTVAIVIHNKKNKRLEQ